MPPTNDKATVARIYGAVDENYRGGPLSEAILREAHKTQLAGCTAIPGIEGLDASTIRHSARP